ncbi:flavin reductase like domain-containing protein [Suillus clintonianus]|uniref:flavin reductase like domain-containing protein n=1 Tax=Suillus clintonianus TaxID=1904413 RepID=UPI001B86B6EF|nr:flavin reductase like domain-containing protein [Suillus clintonianus]KAG2144602.1 flavin reductase like domain-containing protein [Suillus clintonianus]
MHYNVQVENQKVILVNDCIGQQFPTINFERATHNLNHILLRSYSSAPSAQARLVKQSLRKLLRETAQPVAVVTSTLPDHETPRSDSSVQEAPSIFHGATLSSFTSIALDPHPLVAFSLRVPSRMALALNAHAAKPQMQMSSHMVINILSAAQPHIARLFSNPNMHPFPFAESEVQWTRSADGLPVIKGALGALSCTVVGRSLPLSDTRWLHLNMEEWETEVQQVEGGTGLASELFIARVLRVEDVQEPEGQLGNDILRTLPLIYHQRTYTTVDRIPDP